MKILTPCLLSLTVLASAATSAHAARYTIDPTHTHATFEAVHFGTSTNRGRFGKTEGTVEFDRAGKTGAIDVSIDVTALSTGTAAFDKHLQGTDFFNTAVHPVSRFVSDKLVFTGNNVAEVAGTLTLLGKSRPATLKANRFNCYAHPMLKREVCGGDFETTIDRTEWGMDWGVAFGIPKNVRVVIQVEAIAQ